jgi:hypothetical protein
MNIYNSVLLNTGGIIQQVRTTFSQTLSPLQPIDKYITLYTCSLCVEGNFTNSFLPFRFYVDDAEHASLQEVILAGSHFINRRQHHPFYAELVIAFGSNDNFYEEEIDNIVRPVLPHRWKAFAWRKARICNNLMIGISLGANDLPIGRQVCRKNKNTGI